MFYSNKKQLFTLIFILIPILCFSDDKKELTRADSLFDSRKYTEAFHIYQSLFDLGYTSASMLLKMAYIQEGLNHHANVVYFLDLYYKKTADRKVLEKIKQIVADHQLSGFKYDDMSYFLILLNNKKIYIQVFFISLILFTIISLYRKKNVGRAMFFVWGLQFCFILLLFTVTYLTPQVHAIIKEDYTLMHSGPSAGAEPVSFINKGHKLKVLDCYSVWVKLKWENQIVYVKKSFINII